MEALEENVYVTELTLVNTGILDKGTVKIFKISFYNIRSSTTFESFELAY